MPIEMKSALVADPVGCDAAEATENNESDARRQFQATRTYQV